MSFIAPEKEKYYIYTYDVIASPKKGKRSTYHYYHGESKQRGAKQEERPAIMTRKFSRH